MEDSKDLLLTLIQTLSFCGKKLDKKTLQFLTRIDESDLIKRLTINDEYFTKIDIPEFTLNALPKTSRSKLWKRYLMRSAGFRDFVEKIPKNCKETEEATTEAHQINIPINRLEIIQELGGTENIRPCTFTYSQICDITSRHKNTRVVLREKKESSTKTKPIYFLLKQLMGEFQSSAFILKKNSGNIKNGGAIFTIMAM